MAVDQRKVRPILPIALTECATVQTFMLYYKMEDKLLDCIKHINEISKQKVTFDRIIFLFKGE